MAKRKEVTNSIDAIQTQDNFSFYIFLCCCISGVNCASHKNVQDMQ